MSGWNPKRSKAKDPKDLAGRERNIKIEIQYLIYILNTSVDNIITSMSIKAEIDEVLTLLKGLKKDVKEIKDKQAMFTETSSNILQISEDLSRKFDEMINVVGVKTPVTSKKTPAKPKKESKDYNDEETKDGEDVDVDDEDDDGEVNSKTSPKPPRPKSKAVKEKSNEKKKKKYINIMTYFRAKYTVDQTYFNNIIDQKELDALFSEHEKDLKSKKGDKKLKAQVGHIYRAINKNKTKMATLRSMMDKENNEYIKETGTTAVKDQTDNEEEDNNSEYDSDDE